MSDFAQLNLVYIRQNLHHHEPTKVNSSLLYIWIISGGSPIDYEWIGNISSTFLPDKNHPVGCKFGLLLSMSDNSDLEL